MASCIAAVTVLGPIVVVNSGSTDETQEVTEASGAEVLNIEWEGLDCFRTYWKHYLGARLECGDGLRIHDIRYEDFACDPEEEVEELSRISGEQLTKWGIRSRSIEIEVIKIWRFQF